MSDLKSAVKDAFIIPSGIYLASHSVGAVTRLGQTYAQEKVLQPWQARGGAAWDNWLGLIDEFCGALSELIGGAAQDYCPQTNLSSGLVKYLGARSKSGTRNKILMHSHAFPSMGFAAEAMRYAGYELTLIPSQLPAHDPNVWTDALDDKTACALITHVHSNTGVFSPVDDIAKACRTTGVSPLVDIAQSAGIIPMDIAEWDVDAVFGSCVKWLCGGPGAGFMWVNPDHIDTLRPQDVGWFSHENPFEFDIGNFRYASGAKRFWGGTPNVMPYAYALGGIETVRDIGVDNIRANNIRLMQTVMPDIDPALNGGTLCVPITDAQAKVLTQAGVQFDRRGDIARLSFHVYNRMDEARSVSSILASANKQNS